MRACVQQDATGALGTCIRTRMRARQTHAEERGGKGGQRSRHTLDAPAFEYLPASQVAHVSDEVAPARAEPSVVCVGHCRRRGDPRQKGNIQHSPGCLTSSRVCVCVCARARACVRACAHVQDVYG